MKKLLILIGLLAVFSTSTLAAGNLGQEIDLNFVGCLNNIEADSGAVNGCGGLGGYRIMVTNLWGLKYECAIILPTSTNSTYKQYFTVDTSVGVSILVYDKNPIKAYVSPAVGYSYITDSIYNSTKIADKEIGYFWAGGLFDINYEIIEDLFIQAGFNIEYKFYRIEKNNNHGASLLTFVPKIGLALNF